LSAIGRQKTKKKKEVAQAERAAKMERYNELRSKISYQPIDYEREKRPTFKNGNVHSMREHYGRSYQGEYDRQVEEWTANAGQQPDRQQDRLEPEIDAEGRITVYQYWEKPSSEYNIAERKIAQSVARIVERMTGNVAVLDMPEFISKDIVQEDGTITSSRVFGTQLKNAVTVALRSPHFRETAFHESWHWLVDGKMSGGLDILSVKEKSTLQAMLPEFAEMLTKVYTQFTTVDAVFENFPDHEIIAHVAGMHMVSKMLGIKPDWVEAAQWDTNMPTEAATIFEKVQEIYKRIAKMVRKMLGIKTWEQIFDEASNGELIGRYLAKETGKTTVNLITRNYIAPGPTPTSEQIELERKQYDFVEPLSDKFDSPEYLKDLGLYEKFVNTPRYIAQKFPDFAKYFVLTKDMLDHRIGIISRASDRLSDYGNAKPKDKEKLDAAMELAALQSGRYRAGKDKRIYIVNDGLHESGALATLSQPGEVLVLEPNVARIYTEVQEVLNDLLNEMKNSYILNNFDLLKRIKTDLTTQEARKLTSKNIRELAKTVSEADGKDRLSLLAKQMSDIEGHMTRDYAPLSRHGNIGISITDVEGTQVLFETFDTKGALKTRKWNRQKINKRREELKAKFPKVKGYTVSEPFHLTYDNLKRELKSGNAISDIDVMMGMLGNADSESWSQIRDSIDETLRTQGWAGHLTKKKKIPGYSTDFSRSIAQYIMGAASYASRTAYEPHITKAINGIKKPGIRDFAQNHFSYMTSPHEEFSFLRGIGFAWYLGGNISSAIIQWAAIPQFTFGYLTQFAPTTVVAKELTLAIGDAWKAMGSGIANAKLKDFKDVRKSIDFSKAARNKEEQEALERAVAEGELTPMQTLELIGLSPAENAIRYGKASTVWESTQQWLAALFNIFETTGRIVAFLTTYRLMQKPEYRDAANAILSDDHLWRAKSAETPMSEMPYTLGTHAIEDTFGLYGKINNPTLMRGAGASVFQFQKYPLMMLELMARTTKRGFKGASRQQRKGGKKAMSLILLSLFMSAGFWGLPGAEDMKELIEWLYRDRTGKDLDLEKELREMVATTTRSNYVADMVSHGGIRALNANVHRRVGFGETPQLRFIRGILGMGADIKDSLGVPYSLLIDTPKKMIELGHSGRTGEGLLAGAPTFVQKLGQGLFIYPDKGVQTTKGKQLIRPNDITILDTMLNTIGFTPTSIAKARERDRAASRSAQQDSEARSRMIKQLAGEQVAIMRARERKQKNEIADGRRRLKKLLDKAKKSGILDRNLRRAAAKRARQMFSPESVRSLTRGVPKKRRKDVRKVRELYTQ